MLLTRFLESVLRREIYTDLTSVNTTLTTRNFQTTL
jgi:hypothetical protein